MWKPEDQMPYVLSKRAIEKKWIPPKGISGLPPHIRNQIPKTYKYWLHDSKSERMRIREELVRAIKKGEVKIKLEAPSKGTFTLQYQWWKKRTLVRKGPSAAQWNLWIKVGDKVTYFVMSSPPWEVSKEYAKMVEDFDKRWMEKEGSIKPNTKWNPTKDTPCWVDIVDKGKVIVYEDSPLVKKFEFKGKLLEGVFLFTRESRTSPAFYVERVEGAP